MVTDASSRGSGVGQPSYGFSRLVHGSRWMDVVERAFLNSILMAYIRDGLITGFYMHIYI